MRWNRKVWRPAGLIAVVALFSISAGALAHRDRVGAAETAATRSAESGRPLAKRSEQEPPNREAALRAFAELAGVTLAEFRRAVQSHGSQPVVALASYSIPYERLLAFFTRFEEAKLAPAVSEGRLTAEQAVQLAKRQVYRDLRRAGATPPSAGSRRGDGASPGVTP